MVERPTLERPFLLASVSLSIIKFQVSVTPGTISWGDAPPRGLTVFQDPGVSCDDDLSVYECDDEGTQAIEYCPVPGDPENNSLAPIGDNSGPASDVGIYYVRTNSGGSGQCISGMNWYGSWDGGRTWSFLYFECYAYA